jgi:hypothetical protein
VSDWEDEEPDLEDAPSADTEAPEPYYSSMLEWFEGWLRPMYRRSTMGDRRDWCPQWWQHEEAVSRLDALWRAWETLRLDPGTGLSVWWRDHADHHMAALLDPDGPFKQCGQDGHQDDSPAMLAHTAPPPGLFDQTATAPAAVQLDDLQGAAGPSVIDAAAGRRRPERPDLGRSL